MLEPDGWVTVEEVARWAFERSRVVMVNEAHHGASRCVRTRRIGKRLLAPARTGGCRVLAMEAIPNETGLPLLPHRLDDRGGYLGQPEMVDFVDAALSLGWRLAAYEQSLGQVSPPNRAEPLTMAATNEREHVRAANLTTLLDVVDGPILVWCGNAHHAKVAAEGWTPMGVRFAELSGIEHVAIDQTATVRFVPEHRPSIELDDATSAMLDADCGGTAGFLTGDVPTNDMTGAVERWRPSSELRVADRAGGLQTAGGRGELERARVVAAADEGCDDADQIAQRQRRRPR